VPPRGAGLLTYCVLAYHLPLLIAFSIRQRTSFIWGGCMLMPLADLRTDRYGFMKVCLEASMSVCLHPYLPVCRSVGRGAVQRVHAGASLWACERVAVLCGRIDAGTALR
jgi:hypothetical protein